MSYRGMSQSHHVEATAEELDLLAKQLVANPPTSPIRMQNDPSGGLIAEWDSAETPLSPWPCDHTTRALRS